MSYSTTYSGLKADLLTHTEDFSDDFITSLDAVIGLGEDRTLRDLDLEAFQDEIDAGNLTSGSRMFTRPNGIVKVRDIFLIDPETGGRKYIDKRTKSYCEMFAPDPAVEEMPVYYAENSVTRYYFVNTPDEDYDVIAFGIVRPAGLSENNQSTWLSLNTPDLLFQACLVEAENYLKNPLQAKVWQDDYLNDKLPKAKFQFRGMSRAEYQNSRQASTASNPT